MSPLFRFNNKGEATPVFVTKDQLRNRVAALENNLHGSRALSSSLQTKLAEANRALESLQFEIARDNRAWRDMMDDQQIRSREIELLTQALAFRTKERDVLLAGGRLDVGLDEIEDPMGVVVADLQNEIIEWQKRNDAWYKSSQRDSDRIAALQARVAWVQQQHRDVTKAGRCRKCNTGSPCKIVRVLGGTEDPS